MSKFLSEVKGFTPVIDILAQELGLMTAMIYGMIWRHAQVGDGASLDILAEHIAIDRKTVERHTKLLCEEGYLRTIQIIPANLLHPSANNGQCEYCILDFAYLDKHHIIPLSEGGLDLPSNITYLCPNCHRLAHSIQYVADCKIIADGWRLENVP